MGAMIIPCKTGVPRRQQRGFTLVELLIVVLVVAILAAISIVAYNGIQQRARDSQRSADLGTIQQALELYYADNGSYPIINLSGSTVINGAWSTTADGSWTADVQNGDGTYQSLKKALVPKYISQLPTDPRASPGSGISGAGYNYHYFASHNTTYCGTTRGQMYIIAYRLESGTQQTRMDNCPPTAIGPFTYSTIRVVK